MIWWWRFRALCAYLRDTVRTPRVWVLCLLRVRCGGYGGSFVPGEPRWCLKVFGHSDSCAFEEGAGQPLYRERERAKGWDA